MNAAILFYCTVYLILCADTISQLAADCVTESGGKNELAHTGRKTGEIVVVVVVYSIYSVINKQTCDTTKKCADSSLWFRGMRVGQ